MNQESATVLQALFDLVVWSMLVLVMKQAYKKPYKMANNNRILGVSLILLFCIFPFWGGDYFHLQEAFHNYNNYGLLSQEKVYGILYTTFSFSYSVLRLVIWGGALVLLTYSYKSVSPKFDLCIFLFGALSLQLYSYARASLAMSFILFGLAFVSTVKEKKRVFTLLVGISALGVSVFFHKSAVIGITAALSSLFLINVNKKTILIVAILIPFIIFSLQWTLDLFAVMELNEDTLITEHYRDHFVGGEENTKSAGRLALGPLIITIVTRWPTYLLALLYIIMVNKGLYKKFTIGERAYASYAFIIVVMSIGFGFTEGYVTTVLQYRTLFYAMPASAVFLAAVHRIGYNKLSYKIIFWGALLGSVYNMIYSVWCSIVR